MPATAANLQLRTPLAFAKATPKGFSDVSILTKGEAKGHGFMIDDRSLELFMTLTLGRTVPAYLTHEDALDDRLGEEMGIFSGFYRDGDQVRAQFAFLSAYLRNNPKQAETLRELADEYPDKLGISPVMRGAEVWPMANGEDFPCMGLSSRPDGCLATLPSWRPSSIKSCDFVQNPAANVALFSVPVDGKDKNKPLPMDPKTILLSDHTSLLAAESQKLVSLAAQHEIALNALKTQHGAALATLQAEVTTLGTQITTLTAGKTSLETALNVKQAELEEVKKFDMRLAGAPALEVALNAHAHKIPAPAATDQGRWAQYAALCEVKKNGDVILEHVETPAARLFKEKHLTLGHRH